MTWFIFALIAAVLSSANAIVGKKALFKEHAMEYSATLSLVAAILSIPLFFLGSYEHITPTNLTILFFTTFIGSIAYILLQKSSRHLEISTVSPLRAFSPVIIALFAYIILDESITRIQTLGIFLVMVGAYIIEVHKGEGILKTIRRVKKSVYIHYFFIALLIYGITSIVDRYLLGIVGIDPITALAFIHLFLAFQLFVMLSIFYDGFNGIKHGFKNMGGTFIILGFLTIGYRLAALEAIALTSVGLVAAVRQLSILISTIFGGKVFHEKNLLKKTIAAVVMVGGVLLIVI